MAEKMVRKSFRTYTVEIMDGKTGAFLERFEQTHKPKESKVAVDYIKKTGKTNIEINILFTDKVMAIPLHVFMQYAVEVETETDDEDDSLTA